MSVDTKRKRPLAISVKDYRPDGGISIDRAEDRRLSACDAFFLIQVLDVDDKSDVLVTSSMDGTTGELMDPAALYQMWVAFTGYVANVLDVEDPEQLRQKRFCHRVLASLGLAADGTRLEEPAAPPAPPATESSSAS